MRGRVLPIKAYASDSSALLLGHWITMQPLSVPDTFARAEFGTHHQRNPHKTRNSIIPRTSGYTSTTPSLKLSSAFYYGLSNQFVILPFFGLFSSTSVVPLCTVSPRPLPFPSPSFPPIPTDLEPYVAHPWHIKCRRH